MNYKILVKLPEKRENLGQLAVINTITGLVELGPFSCCGRADKGSAAKAGNPTADPKKKNGNTPLGIYQVIGKMGPDTEPKKLEAYGPQPRLRIIGIGGDAKIREMVANDTLRIHGGRPNLIVGKSYLRPTNGCVRLADIEMQQLINWIEANIQFPFSMEVVEGQGISVIETGPDDGYVDPENG